MGTQAKFSAFDSHCVCFIAFFWPGEAERSSEEALAIHAVVLEFQPCEL